MKHQSRMPDGNNPWALAGAPLAAMMSLNGEAVIVFVLVEGSDYVRVLVAPETLDPAAGAGGAGRHVMQFWMEDGGVFFNGECVRASGPDWFAMSCGDDVRVCYVHATRMVSVAWRGQTYELCPLPAACDAAHYRFGVAVGPGNTVRIADVSMPGTSRDAAVVSAFPLVIDPNMTLCWPFVVHA